MKIETITKLTESTKLNTFDMWLWAKNRTQWLTLQMQSQKHAYHMSSAIAKNGVHNWTIQLYFLAVHVLSITFRSEQSKNNALHFANVIRRDSKTALRITQRHGHKRQITNHKLRSRSGVYGDTNDESRITNHVQGHGSWGCRVANDITNHEDQVTKWITNHEPWVTNHESRIVRLGNESRTTITKLQ